MYTNKLGRLVCDVCLKVKYRRTRIRLVYFTGRRNVGDMANHLIIGNIAGKKIYKARTKIFAHLLAIGSGIGVANRKTTIWGAGSIDGRPPDRPIDLKKVHAVRGKLSLAVIKRHCCSPTFSVPLGDPAVLAPEFYTPASICRSSAENVKRIGIVPHFMDEESCLVKFMAEYENVEIIRVGHNVEKFIDKVASVDFVFSSSLHGLILSDSYSIPNAWIKLSDFVIGGDFKFLDYYSTTDAPEQKAIAINDRNDVEALIKAPEEYATVKKYVHSLTELINAFPHSSV